MSARILIVDDEFNIRKVLAATLQREGYEVLTARNGEEAIELFKTGKIQVVVSDLRMPHMDGLGLLRYVQTHYPEVPVIMVTAHGTIDTAVEALKNGAFDYITKPFDQLELIHIITKAVKTESLANKDVRGDSRKPDRYRIIGETPKMQSIYAVIEKVADTPSTVLITGESGTGKELVAAALHYNSSRKARPFIKINCAAIPRELMESELFGYERGAFTGAVTTKPGRFELADSGTLFLDEITEIPVEMQVKLLRAVQENEFEHVGGVHTTHVNVRLVVASNRNLLKQVKEGRFREDLYYRLNVIPIHLPPLRERKDDIPLLVNHFIGKYNAKLNRSITHMSEEALNIAINYQWQGNIRQLENIIERCVLFTEGNVIESTDLPQEIVSYSPSEGVLTSTNKDLTLKDSSLKEIVKQATVELEKDLITDALSETSGNVTQAAKRLRISRKSLQIKMKEFRLREG